MLFFLCVHFAQCVIRSLKLGQSSQLVVKDLICKVATVTLSYQSVSFVHDKDLAAMISIKSIGSPSNAADLSSKI